jgi:hypothetical protein
MSPEHFMKMLGLILVVLALCSFGAASNSSCAVMMGATEARQQAQRPHQRRPAMPSGTREQKVDYTRFSHRLHVVQQKLTCHSCHKFPSKNWKEVREGDKAFPDVTEYPEHQSCLNCHRQQFFARERPVPRICTNCHLKATPEETSRYPFPSLGENFLSSAKAADFVSDFQVYFPHDKHLDVISKNFSPRTDQAELFVRVSFRRRFSPSQESDPKSCSVCHKTHQPQEKSDDEFVTKPRKNIGDSFWLKKGTFKTRPITHASCFTCHNQESELAPLPQNCDGCHKLSLPTPQADFDSQLAKTIGVTDWWSLTAWGSRLSAGAFRHEAHTDLSCTSCHKVTAMNTVEFRTLKVPVNWCGGAEGCHVTATADEGGILNYEIDQRKTSEKFTCVKCHIVFGTKPPPASHLEAIQKSVK